MRYSEDDRPIIESVFDAIEWFENSIIDDDEWHKTKCPDCAANRMALIALREQQFRRQQPQKGE